MRKFWILLVVLIAASMLFISACDEDDINITNIDDAEWVLNLMQLPEGISRAGFMFTAGWNGAATDITASDVFTLTMDNVNIPVQAYFYDNEWIISAYDFQLNPGANYELKFSKNGNVIVEKIIKTCYSCTGSFPNVYDPTTSQEITWTVAGNNQTQFVSVSASNWDGSISYDEELYQVSNSARSYTIPANAVQDLGVGTEYELAVLQSNVYISGTTYITTSHGDGATYESRIKAIIQHLENARRYNQ